MPPPELTRFKSTWLNVPMHAAAAQAELDDDVDAELEEPSIRSTAGRPQSAGKSGSRPLSASARASVSRTLRPFGCNLTLSILYHHGQSAGTRAMTLMPDTIIWGALKKLVERALKLAPGTANRLALQYVQPGGETAIVNSQAPTPPISA